MASSLTQFYVTLPSNSSADFYPSNTLTSYTTHLVKQINLTGNWEVALTEIHDNLHRMLGLKNRAVNENFFGHLPVYVNGGFYGMYVYCDIAENQFVGDVSVSLLRIVPVKTSGLTQGDIIAPSFNTPRYVPLKQKNFEVIQMDLRTDTGEKVAFQRGKVTTTLHFRRTRPSLF